MADRREQLGDETVTHLIAFEGLQSGLWTAMPGTVDAFNPVAMTVSIKPAMQGRMQLPDGSYKWVDMPLLVDCPVVFPGGGGFTLTFPIKVGDEALVIFASRSIDTWWATSKGGVRADLRMHDLSDGFCIVGPRSRPRAIEVDTSSVQLRTDSGAAFISIDDGNAVRIDTPSDVTISCNQLLVYGRSIFGGDVTLVGGSLSTNQNIAALGTIVGNGTSLSTHTHPDADGGNTGVPN